MYRFLCDDKCDLKMWNFDQESVLITHNINQIFSFKLDRTNFCENGCNQWNFNFHWSISLMVCLKLFWPTKCHVATVWEKSGKFKVREKSGNFEKSQGNSEFWKKVREICHWSGKFQGFGRYFVHVSSIGGPIMRFLYHFWDSCLG